MYGSQKHGTFCYTYLDNLFPGGWEPFAKHRDFLNNIARQNSKRKENLESIACAVWRSIPAKIQCCILHSTFRILSNICYLTSEFTLSSFNFPRATFKFLRCTFTFSYAIFKFTFKFSGLHFQVFVFNVEHLPIKFLLSTFDFTYFTCKFAL